MMHEKNEPMWIHRCDVDPRDSFPQLDVREATESEEEGGDDARFATLWKEKIDAEGLMA